MVSLLRVGSRLKRKNSEEMVTSGVEEELGWRKQRQKLDTFCILDSETM